MELLTNAVIEQLGYEELEDEELRSTLEDITNHGAGGGFGELHLLFGNKQVCPGKHALDLRPGQRACRCTRRNTA